MLISIVIVGVSIITMNNVINQVKLSDIDYKIEENELLKASEEIERNVDYYIENERLLFEKNISNELFYLVSYMEVKYGQTISNLSSFLHYPNVEDILIFEDGKITDLNPYKVILENMGQDEMNYMSTTLSNNLNLSEEGEYYYYWPSINDSYKLDRKVVYFKDSGHGYTVGIIFNTDEYQSIISSEVKNWLQSVYSDEILIYDYSKGSVTNRGIIKDFNIKRATQSNTKKDGSFFYEQDGSTMRIIYLSNLEEIDVIIGSQIEIKDYSSIIVSTFNDPKVILTIAIGVLLIIIIKVMEYFWINQAIGVHYFDKRFIYETLEFYSDGVAVVDNNYLVEDCNDRFRSILGLDVFIKNNYNLKKMIPEFKFSKDAYDLIFMNKKTEYVDGNVIVKKIGTKYLVKIIKNNPNQIGFYLEFKEFSDTVEQRIQEKEVYIENILFAMISIENAIKLDCLMTRLKNYFNGQGIVVLLSEIGVDDRIIYVEGVKKKIFDNTLDNIFDDDIFASVKKKYYSSIEITHDSFPINMEYIMEELDFKLYEKRK